MKRDWPVIALVTQLGLTVAGTLVVSLLIGIWLDNTFGPRPLWTLVFALVGIVGATVGVYRMVASAIAETARNRPVRPPTGRGAGEVARRQSPGPQREADWEDRDDGRDDEDEPKEDD